MKISSLFEYEELKRINSNSLNFRIASSRPFFQNPHFATWLLCIEWEANYMKEYRMDFKSAYELENLLETKDRKVNRI